jgi:dTDP-4-amino-4,6-dideoxygalactose transaminase
MQEAIEGGHISGDGPFTQKCQDLLQKRLGAKAALLTTSCTHALELAAILLNISPGDEVILPDFTFVSTANAFVLRGAVPVFVDIRPDTLNLDESLIERRITGKTRAIVPVHYAGIGCDMETITKIARQRGISIVEDNAHGLFADRSSRPLGTWGELATLSFHETKNFSCGEGGALLINDEQYTARAEIVREKGTNRKRFFRGQIDRYTWVDIGSSYVPSELLAAYLLAQLEKEKHVLDARRRVYERYAAALSKWADAHGIQLPSIPAGCRSSYHMFYLVMRDLESRSRLIAHLKAQRILAVFHYLPLHLSEMGQRWGGKPGDCPVTESVSERLVRLPFYTTLSEADQDRVIEAILGLEL